MNFSTYIIKRKIEDVIISPLILLGRIIAWVSPLKKEYETFFFFPFYHTGGAEKVHALVANATGNKNCIIFFTRKSHDANFYSEFVQSGCTIRNISSHTDNKLFYAFNLVYRGIVSGYINRQKLKPLVFNGQSNFGYKISPWINKSIPQVELIHSFNTFSWIRIPFVPFITKTIMISQVRIEDHLKQYDRLNMPPKYRSRVMHIVNGIPMPQQHAPKDYSGKINVLYAGRGTEEKRVELIAKIARLTGMNNVPAAFNFMGDVKGAIPNDTLPYCNLLGHKIDNAEIEAVYNQSHVLIITSSTEGFPLVIEEAMARGCAIIATPVGDIPVHLKNEVNGFLFSSVNNEQLIVKEGVDFLTLLCNNKKLLAEMGEKNRQYAQNHFSIQAFNNHYRQLFHQLRNH